MILGTKREYRSCERLRRELKRRALTPAEIAKAETYAPGLCFSLNPQV